MIPAFVASVAAPSFQQIVAVHETSTVPIPAGATNMSAFVVEPGSTGDPGNYRVRGGDGGAGGSCRWATGVSVAGHSSIICEMSREGGALLFWENQTEIALPNENLGGQGGMGFTNAPTYLGGGGGAPGTEIGVGNNGQAGGLGGAGASPNTASILSAYLGRGGDAVNMELTGYGTAWGGGGSGGAGLYGSPGGDGGTGGALLIFSG